MEEPIANVEPVTNVSSLGQSKKEGKDQELILSSTTPDPEYQWESDNFTIGHHKREPRGQIRGCFGKKKNISQPKHMLWVLKRTVSM